MTEVSLQTPLAADSQAVAVALAAVLPAEGLSGFSIADVRTAIDQMGVQLPELPQVGEVSEHSVHANEVTFTVRVYRPDVDARPIPALLYFHGGGWATGGLDGGVDYLCRDIALRNNIAVVSVDYRLAPENKFPAAVNDAVAALSWVRENGPALGIDVNRLAVGGDSAGANLSAVLTHLDRGAIPALKSQVLFYPGTEYAIARPSWFDNEHAPVLTTADVLWFFDMYATSEERSDPRVCPSLHSSFADLPGALVITAGHDPLRDDGINYASLLERDGTSVRHNNISDTIHGFMTMPNLSSYGSVIDLVTEHLGLTI
ncbi:alpha/beta hydrolase [Rhodococcus sp. WS3]|uniref:alpha/beta hydrolase n=1 Tax=Rhodococcus sp. WS3 TaxID=2486271 RepID=UPI001144B7B6|nr:alpha/beta hydrolase [Rhodococcus sp. WS3]ROZ48980.1 alpha/beta hydrolase [Rhodococcus sp. WS3]